MITLLSPTRAVLENPSPSLLKTIRAELTYTDKRVVHEIQRLKHSDFEKQRLGSEGWAEKLAELRAKQKQCLLQEPEGGVPAFLGGLAARVASEHALPIQRQYQLPEFKPLAWETPPDFKPRPYQLEAVEALLKAQDNGPAAISLATGLGKSYILLQVVKQVGLQAVVIAPGVSIARQLYDEFALRLGRKTVGLYGDGKKELGKKVTVAIAASLARVEEGTKAWDFFRKTQLLAVDESHTCPANVLQNVCLGLLEPAPVRVFVSATQFRQDGLDKVLEGITGPVVYEMDLAEGVRQGYLARPLFNMVECESSSRYRSRNIMKVTQKHVLANPQMGKLAAELANKCFKLLKRPTLILIEEVGQFAHILPHLEFNCGFAHGVLTKDNVGDVPAGWEKSDPKALVKSFNAGELPVLVGTSCVSTGTDFRPVGALIRWKGGMSGIEVRQDIGRGTRLAPGKKDFLVFDLAVTNVDELARHADERRSIYESLLGPVKTTSGGRR